MSAGRSRPHPGFAASGRGPCDLLRPGSLGRSVSGARAADRRRRPSRGPPLQVPRPHAPAERRGPPRGRARGRGAHHGRVRCRPAALVPISVRCGADDLGAGTPRRSWAIATWYHVVSRIGSVAPGRSSRTPWGRTGSAATSVALLTRAGADREPFAIVDVWASRWAFWGLDELGRAVTRPRGSRR